MPELPDVAVYIESLAKRVTGAKLLDIRFANPFLLRSVDPPLAELKGKKVLGLRRLGKRIVFELESELFIVLHLMIAGRLKWEKSGAKITGRIGLCAFDFDTGTLILTEAGTKRRASLFFARGEAGLEPHQRGGLEVLDATYEEFKAVLLKENHTLKRSLTDPRLFSGIGNAYSDEILHAAKLSPMKQAYQLNEEETRRLYQQTQDVLQLWIERLRAEAGNGFPEKVTAFREEMAVHGKYKHPCPVCGTAVQRIVYAENETNYCPRCQVEGRLLADRSLSRLLKNDWPKRIEELE